MAELLDLIIRWVHVIAGIMWVGNSMLFNFLDRNLRKRPEADSYGDIWLLHSGAFYLMEKNHGERTQNGLRLPTPLHWFKWQAYTTWITGALLLIVVYWVGARAMLVDSSIRDISHAKGLVVAIGTIVGTWALYEIIWRTIGKAWPRVSTAATLMLLLVAITLLNDTLTGRAAWVHVGALLGTIMAGNVAFTIMPSQRELVAALEAGREASQEIADRAKTRSIHNNYLTFPVIALMVSAHFPSMYVGKSGASNLVVLAAAGALVRHWMNIRFTYPPWRLALAGTVAVTVFWFIMQLQIGPFYMAPHAYGGRMAEPDSASMKVPDSVTFADVRRVIDRRCAACHSLTPSDVSLGFMPAGIAYDTPEQIVALSARIRERAVVQRSMPPGNKTMMTDAEREILARWIAGGASIK